MIFSNINCEKYDGRFDMNIKKNQDDATVYYDMTCIYIIYMHDKFMSFISKQIDVS